MATITGLTAERMLEIEGESIVDGEVIAGNLILTKHNGTPVDAGSVIGPQGIQGIQGEDGVPGYPDPTGHEGELLTVVGGVAAWAETGFRPYHCSLRNSVAQTQTHNGNGTGGYVDVTWDTEIDDDDNMHSIVTDNPRIIIPEPMVIVVAAALGWSALNTTGIRTMNLKKNGAGFAYTEKLPVPAGEFDMAITSRAIKCVANDYITVGYYQSSAGTTGLVADPIRTWFSLWRVA